MKDQTKQRVIKLLESHQERTKLIELLHYELAHPKCVSESEMIEALALTHGEGGGRPSGRISDKTLYIALSYQERTAEINRIGANEIAEQLAAMEHEQERLKHYVTLLSKRHREVIELYYFKKMSPEDVAKQIKVCVRHMHSIKAKAVDELVSMYEYVDALR